MDKKIESLIHNWHKRNIAGHYCKHSADALKKILEIIPISASVGFSGSVTLNQLGLIKMLELRHQRVFNQYTSGLSRDDSLAVRREGAGADYFIASANAISESGELVFFSAYGNRTAGVAYARHAVIVCGINKVVPSLAEALARSREVATPRNVKRLAWEAPCLKEGLCHEKICFAPDYKRMCCQVLIIEGEVTPDRVQVVLINEDLGY